MLTKASLREGGGPLAVEGACGAVRQNSFHRNAFSLSRLRRQLPPGGSLTAKICVVKHTEKSRFETNKKGLTDQPLFRYVNIDQTVVASSAGASISAFSSAGTSLNITGITTKITAKKMIPRIAETMPKITLMIAMIVK